VCDKSGEIDGSPGTQKNGARILVLRVLERIEPQNRSDILRGFQALVAAMAAEMDAGCAGCAPLDEMGRTDS
jgi:hypothetical protein